MPAKTFDVIVAGGGPAGSTAARECAAAGLRTALFDKAEFPRDKPCGGGVTLRCARLLPFELAPVTERTVTAVRFTATGTSIGRIAGEPLTYLTQRRYLDTFLLERAEAAGVTVMQRRAVTGVEPQKSRFAVSAGGETFSSRYLVAADGANGITARASGILPSRWTGVALEGNISVDPFPSAWRDAIGIDFGHIHGGYGWIFPKGDHVNIGLGGWSASDPSLRSRLDRLVRWYGFDPDTLWNLRGHPLPVRKPGASVGRDRLLLVGDAAGLLDPFTGEGIFAAIWSGRAAASSIRRAMNDECLDAVALYTEDLRAQVLPDLRVSRKLADLFHLAPWLWTQGLRFSGVWQIAIRLLTGEQSYAGASASSGWPSSVLSGIYESVKLASRTRSGHPGPQPLLFGA